LPFCLKDGRRRRINFNRECRIGIGHVMTGSGAETLEALKQLTNRMRAKLWATCLTSPDADRSSQRVLLSD
jgi:hypothetical protein